MEILLWMALGSSLTIICGAGYLWFITRDDETEEE